MGPNTGCFRSNLRYYSGRISIPANKTAGEEGRTIIRGFRKDATLSKLYIPRPEEFEVGGRKFSKDAQAAALLEKTMEHEFRCSICGARLYRKAMTKDHRDRLQDGGRSAASNLDFSHPYCNTGFKEKKNELKRKVAAE